jgi:hypothetical protein
MQGRALDFVKLMTYSVGQMGVSQHGVQERVPRHEKEPSSHTVAREACATHTHNQGALFVFMEQKK